MCVLKASSVAGIWYQKFGFMISCRSCLVMGPVPFSSRSSVFTERLCSCGAKWLIVNIRERCHAALEAEFEEKGRFLVTSGSWAEMTSVWLQDQKINESLTILLVTKGPLLWSETLTAGRERAGIAQRGSSSGAAELRSPYAQEAWRRGTAYCRLQGKPRLVRELLNTSSC